MMPPPTAPSDTDLRLASTGLQGIQVHYRTASIPYRMRLHDLYVVPALVPPDTTPPQEGAFSATLSSPYLRGADVPEDVLLCAPLQFAMRDARCPTCGTVKKPGDAGSGQRLPAALLRCEQCLLCPECHACPTDVYLTKQRQASMTCANCFWSSPSFADTALLTQWLGQCAQSVVRSSCGYSVCLPLLRHASAPLSVSSNARSALNQAISDGSLPFATLREEKIAQLDAALQQETHRILHFEHIAAAYTEMVAASSSSTAGGAGGPSGRLAQTSRTVEALATQTAIVPFVPVPGTTAGAAQNGAILCRLGAASSRSVPLLVHTESVSSVATGGRRSSAVPSGDGIPTDVPVDLPPIQPMQRAPLLPRLDVVAASSAAAAADTATVGKRPQPSAVLTCVGACDAADGTSGSYFTSSLSNSALAGSLCAARFLPVVQLPANLSRWAKCDVHSKTRKRVFLMLKCLNADESRVTLRGLRITATTGCRGARLSVGSPASADERSVLDACDPAVVMPADGIPIPNIRHQPLLPPQTAAANTAAHPSAAAATTPPISSKRRATMAVASAVSPVVGSSLRYYVDNRIADCIFSADDAGAQTSATATEARVLPPGFYVPDGGGAVFVGIDVALGSPAENDDGPVAADGAAPDEAPYISIELELCVDVACAALHTALRTAFGTQTVAHHVSLAYRCVIAFQPLPGK